MLQKFKPFFDLKAKSVEDVVALLLGVFVFGVIVFNAYFSSITYDEAYSYLNTGRIQDVWKVYQFRIANTHFLNSILMAISTLFFPYYDFALRAPAVLISIFYISTAIVFSKKYKNSLLLLGLLLLFYYVIGYMSLARGYGMSATFILAALFVYKDKDHFKEFHLWIIYLFLLAIYASYVAIIPFVAMMGYLFVFEFKFSIPEVSKKHKRWTIGLTLLALYGFYSVTKAGKPLPYDYVEGSQTFFEAVPQDIILRFFRLTEFSIETVQILTLGLVVIIASIFIFFKKKTPFGSITIITFSAIFFASWLAGKPLPTGRVLVPYWPLIVLSVFEVIEFVTVKLKIPNFITKGVNIILVAFLAFNFQSQIPIKRQILVGQQVWKTPIYIMSGYGKTIYPHDEYYLEKEWKHHVLLERLEELEPSEVRSFPNITCKTYTDLGLNTIDFSDEPEGKLLYRTVLENGLITYQDTIEIGTYLYPIEEKYPLLIPFPRFGGDELKIGDVDGSWNTTFQIPAGIKDFFPQEIRHSI